eukprot:TRINITY_DN12487_c0_g2_i1.p1 TRINITY_DN12487_c0_g2~~TRINITY_DN12487_c0_g2_i1.p1  ORF type:complete len:167 (-),score=32.08 TRINITY_DN12487_c0_g2_i1:236-736(-)
MHPANKNTITLKGSTDIVVEFFGYSINSILYQRGIYPPESFSKVNKYGLSMLVTNDEGLKSYLKNVLLQLNDWILSCTVQKLVLIITDVSTKDVLERWVFDIIAEKPSSTEKDHPAKTEKEINGEIAAIIRQITASVTFLPLLQDPCTFDLLVYTDTGVVIPQTLE